MTAWIGAAPALLVAAALVTIPGLPAAWALRLRGLPLLAGAIGASCAIVAVASTLAPFAGMRWGVLPLAIVALVVTLIALGVRFALKPGEAAPLTRDSVVMTAGALLLSGLMIAFMIMRSIGAPENVSQTYDAVFHLNAVAYIQDTGDASPLHMNLVTPGQSTTFYPTLWHAVVALIADLSHASVPLATNALSLVGAAWVWPVAILFFSAPFTRGNRAGLLLAAIFAATASAFPYLLLTWGVVYPNFLATALLPIALGFMHLALRPRDAASPAPKASLWIASVGSLGGATLAHPNALFGMIVLMLPLLLVYVNDVRRRDIPLRSKLPRWAAVAVTIAVPASVWWRFDLGDSDKHYGSGFAGALVEGLTNAPMLDTRSLFITLFVLSGAAILMVRRRHRWVVASYAMALVFFAVAYGLGGPIRTMITGPWYNDASRLAALLPIVTVPLAAVSAGLLLEAVTRGGAQILRASREPRRADRLAAVIALLAVGLVVLTGARGAQLGAQGGWMGGLFNPAPAEGKGPDMLSVDERKLLDRLDEEVPEDALVIGDPWNGSASVYSIAHRKTLFPHMTAPLSEDAATVAAGLRDMGPEACSYLDRLGVDYVLDFGDPYFPTYRKELSQQFAGLRDVGENPVLQEVDHEGDAALYRVECG